MAIQSSNTGQAHAVETLHLQDQGTAKKLNIVFKTSKVLNIGLALNVMLI